MAMGGGPTMREFLHAELVDQLRLRVVPLLFGSSTAGSTN